MNARTIASALAALFVGLWIGRALPMSDLRRARAEIAGLKSVPRQPPAAARAALTGVESVLNIQRADVAEARRARRVERTSPPGAPAVAAVDAATNTATSSAGLSNKIARVQQAWDLRREVARSTFIDRTKLDSGQAADFDVLIEAMNVRLGTAIDRWADRIRKDEVFTAETGARMMSEMSAAVVLTYDELDRKLPPSWRQAAGPHFELVRFVDPEVLTPLQDLEDIMPQAGTGGDDPPAPVARGAVP